MDLPPDKAKLLRNYDDEKKWDMICDQVSNKLLLRLIRYKIFFSKIKFVYTLNF